MNSHLVRTAGLFGLTSVIATLGVAAVASAAPAGGAQQATTSRPDVVSAVITDQPSITNATGSPQIKVCFDSQIATPNAAAFAVTGTDVVGAGNPLAPATAQPIPTELNCVSLTYLAGTNLAGFSVVEVEAGAVTPPGGGAGTNPQGSAALTGGDVTPAPGKTAGPNLVGVSAPSEVAGGSEFTFAFDKLISQSGEAGPAVGAFGYYNNAGLPVAASSIVAVSDRAVKVKFAALVPASSRAYVTNNAVRLASQPEQGNAPAATPGGSNAPDLVSVARVGSLQATYDLTYDATITSTNALAGNCQANTPAGQFAGTAAQVLNATTIRVTFGALAASNGADLEIVRISDRAGCAISTAAVASSVGAAPVQNKDHTPGFTSGPDLSGCSTSGGGTDVTFTFDELLAPGAASAGFGLIDANGVRTNGTGDVLQVTENRATVRFASAGELAAAVGCTVNRGSASDRQPGAEPSSLNTVKANSEGTPENAKPAPPPVVVPGPPPGPPAPFVKRAVRSLGVSSSCRAQSRGRIRCTTKGTLKLSADLTPLGKKLICIGTIRIRYTSGKRVMSSRTSTIRKTCTYNKTVTFRASRRQRANLRVQAKYNGSVLSRTKSSKKIRARTRR